MSSGLLYLAIVAVWALVLVPMWIRGSGDAGGMRVSEAESEPNHPVVPEADSVESDPDELDASEPHGDESDAGEPIGAAAAEVAAEVATVMASPEPTWSSRSQPVSRARIVARRRRLLTSVVLLLLLTVVAAMIRQSGWWTVSFPVGLLIGAIALLRTLAADERRQRDLAQTAHAAARAPVVDLPEVPEQASPVEDELFDQYAPDRSRAPYRPARAVGD